jgi:hypothetical protein
MDGPGDLQATNFKLKPFNMAGKSAIFVRGKIGNVVGIERNGSYYVKAHQPNVKQTAPTKKRSSNLAVASSFCKHLRPLLRPVLPFKETQQIQGKFLGAFLKWFKLTDPDVLQPVDRIPFVSEFNYNPLTSVSERWKLPLTVTLKSSTRLELSIPAFIPTKVIAAPAHTVLVECTIVVASCMLAEPTRQTTDLKRISIPFSNAPVEAQLLKFDLAAVTGMVVVTAVALTYRLANGKMHSAPAFMPVSIIDARYC